MAYLGNESQANFSFVQKQTFNGDNSTTDFQLRDSVGLPQEIQVYVENVRQEPTTAYTVSGKTLSFTEAPPTGTGNIYVVFQQPTRTALVTERSIDGTALQQQFNFDGTSFTTSSANTNIFSDHLNVTANSIFQGQTQLANVTSLTVTPGTSNTNIFSDHLNITANVDFNGVEVTGLKEPWTIVNSNTTMSASRNYFANTRNSLTLTLPTAATLGDAIRIVDNEGLASSNNITISRNGHNIQGQSANLSITTARAGITLVYESSRNGWVLRENF